MSGEKIQDNAVPGARFSRTRTAAVPMGTIEFNEDPRIETGIEEFDRVLGGGIVPGTLVLIGGDPGVGKSTLMLQILSRLAESGKKTLYVSGEESIRQIKMRGNRLSSAATSMLVAAETDLDSIISMAEAEKTPCHGGGLDSDGV